MTDEELAHRKPVWIALADLFLDTDVRLSYVSIVRVLARSPYPLAELRQILDDEVTPALQSNLLQVAGEWAMFPKEWVVERVTPRAGKRRWLPNLVNLDDDWRVLAGLIELIRSLPEEERERRLDAWQALMPLLLGSPDTPNIQGCAGMSPAEAERILREDLMPWMR